MLQSTLTRTGHKTSSIVVQLPKSYNELDSNQLKTISCFVFSDYLGAAMSLLNTCVPKSFLRHLTAEQLWQLCECLRFLENIDLTKNLFPKFSGLVGPADLLAKTTVNEYARADKHFRDYLKTEKIENLHALTACLYRPQRPDFKKFKRSFGYTGDDREPFNANKLDENIRLVRKLPIWFHYFNLLFFIGCKNKFLEMFPAIFPKNPQKKGSGSWADTKLDLAESHIFGDLEATGEAYIIAALAFLNKKTKEEKEFKEKHGIS